LEIPLHLLHEKRDGIAWLTMNRPERRNAISPEMLVRLRDAWRDFRDDSDTRVAVLTGAGDKAFCAGADIKLLIPLFTGARQPENEWDEALLADREALNSGLLRDFELYKPVIAAVNGFALAGGTEILQATDIRIACPEATFGLSEAKRGIIPAGGSLVRLQRQIPFAKAMEILLTGDPMSAEEAHRKRLCPFRDALARCRRGSARVHGEAQARLHGPLDEVPLPDRGADARVQGAVPSRPSASRTVRAISSAAFGVSRASS
jgi:enoyl-CoA hydratase/carnithine racemase